MIGQAVSARPGMRLEPSPADLALQQAVLRAIAYADVFDYPLTLYEIHRYLPECPAELSAVRAALIFTLIPEGRVENFRAYFMLPGRSHLAEIRQARLQRAASLRPRAQRYAGWLARLPFVRMVALTGAFAVENEPGSDIDFLVVTEPGRLWLCRGLAMLLVRAARLYGDELCPNYFITTRALSFPAPNLYTAHELAQMVPLSGLDLYRHIRDENGWLESFLPNAVGAPMTCLNELRTRSSAARMLERFLSTRAGDVLEAWEMRRKIHMLKHRRGLQAEADFGPDWCKGHFGGYGRKALDAFRQRLESLGL